MNRASLDQVLRAPCDHADLPYGTNLLPNPRDVSSPWGSMRAYEWGPADGRKVLIIHGLSTPSPALAVLAQVLVSGGCRAMIFDLWGRGFSDTPKDLNHDMRLYASEILLALSSSPIPWTGSASGGFTIIGYSMGGALAMAFARWFPQLVHNIILLAPGGLYKQLPSEYTALCVRYPWMFPHRYVTEYIRNLLNGTCRQSLWSTFLPTKTVPLQETPDQKPKDLDVTGIVNWEIDTHPGFVPSVSSALRYTPVVQQHPLWNEVRNHIEGKSKLKLAAETPNRLEGTKILLLLGKDDLVLHSGYQKDIEDTLGRHNLEVHEFDGGHSFPVGLGGRQVAETILRFWQAE